MTLGQTTEVMILLKALQWGRVDLNEESFLRKDHQSEPDSRSISSTLPQETLTENSNLTFLLKLGTLSLNLLLEGTLLDLLYQILDIKIYAFFDLV
jgi:hypothetical protein